MGWGILTLCHAFVKTEAQLIAVRLLIGVFEAGFYPTTVSFLSTFYPRFDLAFRIALFYGSYAIAGECLCCYSPMGRTTALSLNM